MAHLFYNLKKELEIYTKEMQLSLRVIYIK
jgi:hypothetical protein